MTLLRCRFERHKSGNPRNNGDRLDSATTPKKNPFLLLAHRQHKRELGSWQNLANPVLGHAAVSNDLKAKPAVIKCSIAIELQNSTKC